jgi:hypothetical protein
MKRIPYFSKLVWILLVFGLAITTRAETLSGRVYEGEYLSEPPAAQGLSDVSVKLYGSHSSGTLGDEVSSDTTGSDGWYGLETEQGYEYFTIVCEGKSGYSFKGSFSIGGSASGESIKYSVPLDGKTLTGNKFWYTSSTPEPPSNNPPIAQDDSTLTTQNTSVAIDVLTNDRDPDGDPLNVQSVTDPPNGSVVNNGNSVTYVPDTGFTGTDSFEYTVSDGKGGTDTATVVVSVLQSQLPTTGTGTIRGVKFNDFNGNRQRDPCEPGLPYWEIELWQDGSYKALIDTTMTDASGAYAFESVPEGEYEVHEIIKSGWDWVQTYPGGMGYHTVTLSSGQVVEDLDFGNRRYWWVDGQKLNDSDGDGQPEPWGDDEGLAGWRIYLDLNDNGIWDAGEPNGITGADGLCRFRCPEQAGDSIVREVMQPGWEQIIPGLPSYSYRFGSPAPEQYPDGAYAFFLNRQTGTEPPEGTVIIRGIKYNDLNDNGKKDPGEPNMPGWEITLEDGDNNLLATTTTGADGRYTLIIPRTGTYIVKEVQQSGWRQTEPVSAYHFQFASIPEPYGELDNNNFGNHQTVTEPPEGTGIIRGVKFNDINGNRQRDPGEPGLPDWVIEIWLDQVTGGALEDYAITDASGAYVSRPLPPGKYQIRETPFTFGYLPVKTDWTQTYPEPGGLGYLGYHTVSLEADQTIEDIDFGNRLIDEPTPGAEYEEEHGDAPEPYSDFYLSVSSTHFLGGSVDGESIMQRDPDAIGDDNDGNDDEDGVNFITPLIPGQQATVQIDLTHVTGPYFSVYGHIDFDRNGSWDPGESILQASVTAGVINTVTFSIPATAQAGLTFARFYIIDTGPVPPWGLPYGEVEDYCVKIEAEVGSGSVVVVKEATPADDTPFFFCADFSPGGFFDTLCQNLQDPSNNTWTINNPNLLQKVSETVTTGWTLTDITITGDTDNGSTIDLANATVDVDFDEGENIVITFKNERTGGVEYDFGDAPDSYKTRHNSGGPYHDVGQVMLGSSVDAEMDGQPGPLADADNDDGISFPLGLAVGQPATVIIIVNAPVGVPAAITGWIDYDHNGTFDDNTERAISGAYTGAGSIVAWTETFLVPQTATAGDTYARFRIYRTEPGVDVLPSPTGYGEEGEVEDYRIEIKPEGTTPSGNIIGGIKFNDINGNGLWEGGEPTMQNWTFWLDTNNDGTPDLFTKTTSAGKLGGSFDFVGLGPGTYTLGEEQQPGWTQTCPIGSDTVTITFPDDGNQRASVWFFGNHGLDFGDAPSSYGIAWHDIGRLRMGDLIDAENISLSSPNADGDDIDNTDDEDGLILMTDLVRGQNALIHIPLVYSPGTPVNPYSNCTPVIWIDYDHNGSFQDPTERLDSSKHGFSWTPQGGMIIRVASIPTSAKLGTTIMRIRVSTELSPFVQCSLLPTGYGGEGEVEDHLVEIKAEGYVLPPGNIVGGIKFNDLNGNKQQDMGEPGLANWVIWIDLNGNGIKDSGEETLTNLDGSFYFFGLTDGTYTVYEEMQSGWAQTYPGGAGTHIITVQADQQIPSIIFGNKQNRDYGDAPANYPSASHELGGPWLGSIPPDAESGMQPNPPGFGDNNNGINDEDGVTFLTDLVPGQPYIVVLFHMDPNGPYRITQGWIDFNRDGYWDDKTEYVGWVGNGGSGPAFAFFGGNIVPAGTTPGKTYARFRICRVPDLSTHINPDGDLGPGEVEDYEVEIVADGNTLPPGAIVQGYKFNDIDGNKMWGPNEPALAGWTIWLDANQNGIQDANDLYTQTGTTGSFLFTGLAEGQYLVGEVQQAGWTQTTPVSGTYTVTADPNLPYWAIQFGNQRIGEGQPLDWGDAPDPNYPTLQASNGAYHVIVPGIFLGGGVDAEPDGLPSSDALGDDNNGSSDEDGVTFITPLMPGQPAEVEVFASSAGYLDAWIDFDADGSWTQALDQVFTSEPIFAGSNILSFQVPASITTGIDTYARFRFSSSGALSSDGAAHDGEVEDYHILLGENGPGVPSEERVPHVKWSQPPIEIDPNVEIQPIFCGWNEPARSTVQSGSKRQWRMNADDFRCLGPIPVTRIRWWGGYKAWTHPEPPEVEPEIWHIGFWANQVEGINQNELFLERLVWSLEIPAERVHFEPAGLYEFPEKLPSEMCFVYEVQLEPEEWFSQASFASNEDVFWISITAVYPADAQQVNMWGWLTRPHIWGKGAVMPAIMGDWPTFDERLFPGRIYPIENSLLCGQNQAYDMCFELLTEQPSVKWDQPFTGIREWQDYSDETSMALKQDESTLSVSHRIADDWVCESEEPVTAIAWNGSYIGYGYEACKCDNAPELRKPDYFLLSIWNNTPGDDTELEHYPSEKIWEYEAYNYDEVMVGYDRNPEGEPNEPIFRYSVRLPEEAWFRQEKSEQLYWFSIVAVYRTSTGEIPYEWGWTNHSHMFGSPALSIGSGTQTTSQWQQQLDSTGRPVDMSFMLFTAPELRPVAHWKFDEIQGTTAIDSIGSHHGEVHNGTWTTGIIEGALAFNGLNTYVDMGDSYLLAPDEMTLALWMRPEHMGGARFVVNRAHTLDFTDYAVLCHSAGQIEFVFDEQGSGPGSIFSNTRLALEEWAHVAVTRDSNQAAIFINGQMEGAQSCGNRSTGEGFKLTISSRRGQTRFFNGKIDEVRLYDQILSEEHISRLAAVP